jgi:hypothetical protein
MDLRWRVSSRYVLVLSEHKWRYGIPKFIAIDKIIMIETRVLV